jgi:hypothetical protein
MDFVMTATTTADATGITAIAVDQVGKLINTVTVI